ncbi:MAG: serine/threonine protein kinase [Labilithrix sp.]|nr:serine/threonine protein kinase [Labilithrix sp.]MCW5815850.1 serine/threonine protein kinase [Labilithrix sp.]
MPLDDVQRALSTLLDPFADPEVAKAVRARWREGGKRAEATQLSPEIREAADALAAALPGLTHTGEVAELGEMFSEPSAEVLFAWVTESTWRRDALLAQLLDEAAVRAAFRDRVPDVARRRVVEGPLADALRAAPLLGDGAILALPENAEARARLEILFWEAGASAFEVPELAKWLWGSHETFEIMIRGPARGALRGRVLAARTLEVSVRGLSPATDQELIGKTLQVLQPLLLHPEPLVWVHAARALGRMIGPLEQLQGTILDWVLGPSQLLRQRAMTALAALPRERFNLLAGQLITIMDSPQEDAWVLAAIAAATPYLFFERRDLWDRLAVRILRGDGGAIGARALARGLATIWRRGTHRREIEEPLLALREQARSVRAADVDEARRWIEVIAVTDVVDGAERDPLDLELGLENLVRLAAQYDDEEADARASRFAVSLAPTFGEARRIALGTGSLRHRSAAVNAVEGCARAFALRLWGPLLATSPGGGDPIEAPDLEETWKTIARAPAEILDLIKERRAGGDGDTVPLEVLAIRLGGYALDACGEDTDLGPGRGPTAHDTCQWLRKIDGLADGTRELPKPLRSALSSLFWRLVDTTRGTALGEVDDVHWLGPFAAWWALVIDRPAMLLQLATALPMMDVGALQRCCDHADALRTAVSSGEEFGQWGHKAAPSLEELHAVDTELTHALAGLSRALAAFAPASGKNENLEAMCLDLVLAADRLQSALADPVRALHPATADGGDDTLRRGQTENAPRVAGLVARAIRARELSMLDVWFASLGPVTSALLEQAVRGAIGRTPPPPPAPKKAEAQIIAGYELVKNLGEGGIGTVWLVRKPGADRFFVLKIPKAEALQNATETERAGILASFQEEAKALAGLYHPNVANIIDRGVIENVPYLVLEYLIGADLKQYSGARLMTLFELRQVVLETCAGLAALHAAGLVHRDIKPANLWLRLPLQGGERFEADKHRDPAHATPLATVVIDFGMVRAIRVPAEVGGRFVAGTAGYIAPEQVLDPVELDPRSDVYALAGTIYNVTTGKAFFDDVENPRDRIIAHMRRDPFEESERLKSYPAAVAKLLRAAVAKEPKDRPHPLEFGREFVAAL